MAVSVFTRLPCRTEHADRSTVETRYYISSAKLDIERLANGVRGHWAEPARGPHPQSGTGWLAEGVESMHWLLDVEFKDDLSRYRIGHGAKNMAVVRHFGLNFVRADPRKASVKTKRKSAGWDTAYLLKILSFK